MSTLTFGPEPADMTDLDWFGYAAHYVDPEPEVLDVVQVSPTLATQIILLDRYTGSRYDLYGMFDVSSEEALYASIVDRVRLSGAYGELYFDWSALSLSLQEFEALFIASAEDPSALVAGMLGGVDVVTGGIGSDLLRGFAGDDTLVGGAGIDTALYAGNAAEYSIASSGHGTSLTVSDSGPVGRASDGTDRLAGIDALRFADRTLVVRDGSEQRLVNTTVPNRQEDVDVAVLGHGGWVATWTSYSYLDASFFDILGQRFDVDGNPLGPEFRVHQDGDGSQQYSAVAALTGGGFVAAWQTGATVGEDVLVRVYAADGAPVTADLVVGSEAAFYESEADVAGLRDGGFVVVWRSDLRDGDGAGVFAARFDAQGAALGADVQVSASSAGQQYSPAVTALADGGFMVAWTASSGFGGPEQVFARAFAADGGPRGGEVRLGPATGNQLAPTLATLSDGSVLAAWVSTPGIGLYDGIDAQRLTADGTPVGPVLELTDGGLSPRVGATPDGGFALSFEGMIDQAWWAPAVRWFDGSGNPLGPVQPLTQVPEQYAPYTPRPALSTLHDGRVVVAWQSAADSDILAREIGRTEIEGSSSADHVRAGVGAQLILGLTGDDTLYGGADDDVLDGGPGADALDGGTGRDTARYDGALAGAYTVTRAGTSYTVQDAVGTDGTDALTGIEALRFADMAVNLTVQAAAAPSASLTEAQRFRLEELYVAFFNRTPDADGLEYWIGRFKAGMTINEIAESFYAAGILYPQLTGYSANMTNADFVNTVYRNVLGREDGADEEGLAYWTGELEAGRESRGSLVSTILDSAHTFEGDPTWGWVADLLDNKIVVADTFAVQWGLNYLTAQESIAQGMAIAAAVTPTDIAAAIALIGIEPGQLDLS